MYLVLGPTLVAESGSALQVGFSVAYPAGDLVLLVGLASVLTRGSALSARLALRLLVAGVVLFVLGDVVYGYASLHSGYESGDPIDTAWMVALALMAIAGTTQRGSDVRSPSSGRGTASAGCRPRRSRSASACCCSPCAGSPSSPGS